MRIVPMIITAGAALLGGCTVSSQSGGLPSPDYTAAPAGYYVQPSYQATTYAPATYPAPPLYSPQGMPANANQGPAGSR